jgi:hypothetical protein
LPAAPAYKVARLFLIADTMASGRNRRGIWQTPRRVPGKPAPASSRWLVVGILRPGGDAEEHGADVFLVLAHQQVLNFCAATNDNDQQPRRERIERAAMADPLRAEAAADIATTSRGHAFGFVDQQDAIEG